MSRTRAEVTCGAAQRDSLTVIASKIHKHLERFENDPKINKQYTRGPLKGSSPFWHATAYRAGRYIGVVYIGYQGASYLTREEAEAYLRWLDAGNIGRHFEALQPEKTRILKEFMREEGLH